MRECMCTEEGVGVRVKYGWMKECVCVMCEGVYG